MKIIIAIMTLLIMSTMCCTSCDKSEENSSPESETHSVDVDTTVIDTVDKINAVAPSYFKYLSYVFYEHEEKWWVAKIADDYKTVSDTKALEPQSVTVNDMLNVKTDMSMDVYDVVRMIGLPIDSRTSGMISMVFKSDCGAEATVYFCADNTDKTQTLYANGIVFDPVTINFTGLRYSEIEQIMGVKGTDAGNESHNMQWNLDNGKILKIWLSGYNSNSPYDCVVTKYVIE